MKLFVDDNRDFPKSGFECCRDAETAILLLSIMDFDFLDLDYHLGDGGTGLDILTWMDEHKISIPRINIHSSHEIGKEKMKEFCKEKFPDTVVTMLPI